MTRRIDSPDTDADLQLRELLAEPTTACFTMNAGAGSGKTTSLVKALSYLHLKNGPVLKRNSQQAACITYTEVAATEIHKEVDDDPLFHVSTIHSFLWSVIRPFKRDIRAWVAQRINQKILDLEAHNAKPRTRATTVEKNVAEIGRLKTSKTAISTISTFTYGIGSRYHEGVLGHDDIIKMVPQLILEKSLLRRLIARKYPFIFVDESQDTFPEVVNALKSLASDPLCNVCIGFFGDPMQQIYASGVGNIRLEPGWKQIDKPENFRCPTKVLAVINNIRSETPEALLQKGGRRIQTSDGAQYVQGEAHLFILPVDEPREFLLRKVRRWLAANTHDPAWEDEDPADVRILVLEHRLAARRLGFESLFSSHNDKSTEELKSGLAEGTAWTVLPFISYLSPLAHSVWSHQRFRQVQLLRAYSPLMRDIKLQPSPSSALRELSTATESLAQMFLADSGATVADVLRFAITSGLFSLNEKFMPYETLIHKVSDNGDNVVLTPDDSRETDTFVRFLKTPAPEIIHYQKYLNENSVYDTQQGVKGAEFERVLILLEDDAAAGNFFSYNKLLGLQELSARDRENIAAGRDSTISRTRRLLYVGCSRAESSLGVVLFTHSTETAMKKLKQAGIFAPECIHGPADLC